MGRSSQVGEVGQGPESRAAVRPVLPAGEGGSEVSQQVRQKELTDGRPGQCCLGPW